MTNSTKTDNQATQNRLISNRSDEIFEHAELHITENNLFSLTFDAIKNAKNSSQADNKRAKRLSDILSEFQKINSTTATTQEQVTHKSRLLCEFIARNKDIFLNQNRKRS